MNYMKLDRIVTISSGQNAPQDQNEYCLDGYTFIKVSNLDDIINDDNESKACKITVEAISNNKLKVVPKKSILFAKSGLSCVKNRVYLTKKETYVVNHLCILSNVIDSYDPEWLLYFIKAFDVTKLIKDESYPSISLKDIKNINVPVISKEKQQSMIKNLNYINSLIKKKQKESFFLDELIKSRFIEMFETIDLSEQRNTWKELGTVSKIYTGTTPSTKVPENWDGDILWITPAEMNKNTFYVYDTARKITEIGRKSKSLDLMPINTVLLSTRAPIGKVGIVGKAMACNQGFKNFECSENVNPVFLYTLLRNNTEYLNSLGSGTTFLEVSKSKISKMLIPVPPIELQNEFAKFVNQINKSKFIVQKEIKDLQELLDKKMDEYFGQ